jgi:hypothetical protein
MLSSSQANSTQDNSTLTGTSAQELPPQPVPSIEPPALPELSSVTGSQPNAISQQPAAIQQDPLAQLRDIHTPTDIITGVLVTLFVVIKRHIAFNQARKIALKNVDLVSNQAPDWAMQLNALLKRAALTYFEHEAVAGLHGTQWHAFLLANCPRKQQEIEEGLSILNANLYSNKENSGDFTTCQKAVKTWIKHAAFNKDKQAKTFIEASE